MDTSEVLRDRALEPTGLSVMTMVSALVHGAVLAVLVLAPRGWFAQAVVEDRPIMTISLGGGTPGPQNGGMTAAGGRPVQSEAPPEPARREAVRPLAAKTPEMVLPRPGAVPVKRSATAAPVVKEAPDDAHGRTPTKGAQTAAGSAVAETGVRGQGFGLSSSGGAGSGSRLDVADFCCPDYLILMIERIRSNWNARADTAGDVVVMFTIQRDGMLTDVTVEKSSGVTTLNLAALRAILGTRQLPALPSGFPNPTLTVHLNFQYTR